MITGSIVALVTPMNKAGDIDWPCLEKLIEWHISQGTNAIVAMGTTGESATLDVSEHCKVIEFVVKHVAGRLPVIAGTGANSTSEAIELTAAAQRVNADAALLVTPYYNKPTQEGLYLHYKAVAEAVAIPQILYNVPGRTACDMSNQTVERLASIDNIVGIKDATGDLVRGKELIQLCGDKIAIYSGDDLTALDLIAMGAHGNISVTANVAPKQISEVCKLLIAGNETEARKVNDLLIDLHNDLFVEANPIPVKWAMFKMGLIEEGIRLPLTPLSSKFHGVIEDAIQKAGLVA